MTGATFRIAQHRQLISGNSFYFTQLFLYYLSLFGAITTYELAATITPVGQGLKTGQPVCAQSDPSSPSRTRKVNQVSDSC